MKPTVEQQTAVTEFVKGTNLVLTAVAGSGKTSTLRLMAEANPNARIAYVAFNKAIATEAQHKMPKNVTAKTAHAFAFGAVGKKYARRLNGNRIRLADAARFLGISGTLSVPSRDINKYSQTRIVLDMVARFCRSDSQTVESWHLPAIDGVEKEDRPEVARVLLPFARKAWEDLQQTTGTLRFTHDHYLKLWQMSNPQMGYDIILFDEAQDANPVIASVVESQNAQLVQVGDSAQSIYAWAGAIDALERFGARDGVVNLRLTQSFRFGPAIAEEANHWLAQLGKEIRVVGNDAIDSTVGHCEDPDAILCRTNAGAISAAMAERQAGRSVHIVGGSNDLESFARGALDLQRKGFTTHKDLSIFKSWGDVRDYCENEDSDMSMLVRLIDSHGADSILEVLASSVDEKDADVTISTAHKSKGREWDNVEIAADFAPKDPNTTLTDGEIMLRYVAVTRAKHTLNPGPLTRP